jgi:hypothetical protein
MIGPQIAIMPDPAKGFLASRAFPSHQNQTADEKYREGYSDQQH